MAICLWTTSVSSIWRQSFVPLGQISLPLFLCSLAPFPYLSVSGLSLLFNALWIRDILIQISGANKSPLCWEFGLGVSCASPVLSPHIRTSPQVVALKKIPGFSHICPWKSYCLWNAMSNVSPTCPIPPHRVNLRALSIDRSLAHSFTAYGWVRSRTQGLGFLYSSQQYI